MTALALNLLRGLLGSRWFWLAAGAAGALWLAYRSGRDDVQAEWDAANKEAVRVAAIVQRDHAVTLRVRDMQIAAFKDELEKQHATRQTEINGLLADNRRLARELGGLRDPGRRPGGEGAVPTPAQPAAGRGGPACGNELSAEATEFLLEFAADADRVAEQYETCRAWAVKSPEAGRVDSQPVNERDAP